MLARSPLSLHLIALLASATLAVLITWPAALDLSGGLIGHPGNDTWNHVWGYWWFLDGFMNRGGIPSHTALLNYPRGGTLFFIDGFNAALSTPLQLLFGLPAAYNLIVIWAVTWTLFGAWTLAHHVLRDPVVAWVPALIYGASPHLLGQTYNGITETINAGWIPLYLTTLLMTLERPRPARGLMMGVTLALCAISNFYYGLFGILLSVVVVMHRMVYDAWRVRWPPFFAVTALGAAVFSAMVLPVLGFLQSTMDAEDALVGRAEDFVWQSLLRHNITDVIGFFRPGKVYSPDLKALYGEELLIVTYLGWFAIALAVAGVVLNRRRREVSIWIWVFAIFIVFSLGPYLHIDGSYVELDGRSVPLPFLLFFKALPIFSRISHPFRFVVPATLGLALLAGAGTRLLLRGLRGRAKFVGVGAICAAILAEMLLASPAVWPLPRADARIPAAYDALTEDGAVLDLPITVPNLERAVYTYYQTAHARPTPYGLNDPMPASLNQNRLTFLLVNLEASRALSLPRLLPELELVSGADLLRDQGYAYIVVHERLYPAPKREMIESVLTATVGPPRKYPEDGVAVYPLE